MKKITLLMTALLWSSLFYGQTYVDEGFESGIPGTWVELAGSTNEQSDMWVASSITANSGTQCAYYSDDGGGPIVSAGSFVIGQRYRIQTPGDTNFVLVGAANNDPETEFIATGAGAGTGTAYEVYVGDRWLISPSFDLTSATSPELTYYEAVDFPGFAADIEVFYILNYAGGIPTGEVSITDAFGFVSGEQKFWKFRGAFDLSAINGQSDVRIAFRYIGTLASRWFIDDVKVREMPTCQEPTSGTFSSITDSSADFTFTPYPSQGETSWDVELVDITGGESQGGGTTTSESSTTKSFTSLTPSNDYEVYVRANCGGGDSAWSGPFAFSTLDSNDDCSGANSITQEIEIATAASATAHNGTVNGATGSGVGLIPSCDTGQTDGNDVWFSFVAQTDGVNINVDGSGSFDPIIEIFSTTDDTCGTLAAFDCIDNNITPPNPPSEAYSGTGFEAGKTYFVRVYDWNGSTAPADSNFTIKIWSSESLSEPEIEKDVADFRFYPNPVQNKLNLRAQDNIENISVFNMLGQEVMRQTPNKNLTEVDMSGLQTGSYFVRVTINGISETKQIIKR